MFACLSASARRCTRRRFRRTLPAVLIAAAFGLGLAAAAPHSIHHLGEAEEQRQHECPGVLAWAAATGADCPAPAITLNTPPEIDRISHPGSTLPSPVSVATPLGRAPPPISHIAS